MTSERTSDARQGTGRHARLLDHQDPRHHPRRNRRRHRDDELARRDDGPPGALWLPHRHRDLRRSAGRPRHRPDPARRSSTRGSIGQRSSPRPPAERPSPTSPTARSALAIRAARCCFWRASFSRFSPGGGRLAPSTSTPSRARARRPFTGSRSLSRRPSAPRSATGAQTAERRRLGLGLRRRRTRLRRRPRRARDPLLLDEGLASGLFWAAFILTRPLGATVGDFLDKPLEKGGLALSRPIASAVLAVVILLLIWLLPQRPGSHPGQAEASA